METNKTSFLTSAAYLAYLVREHSRLELKKQALLEIRRDKDAACECKTECGNMSLAFTEDYALTERMLREYGTMIARFAGAVLPPPRDRKVLLPGLRARLRTVDRRGRSYGDPVRIVDVGLHAEFCPSAEVPIVGASCRQIRPFIGQPRGFCADLFGFDGIRRPTKLVGIEHTPMAL